MARYELWAEPPELVPQPPVVPPPDRLLAPAAVDKPKVVPYVSSLMLAIRERNWQVAWEWVQWMSKEEVCMASPWVDRPQAHESTPSDHTALHLAAFENGGVPLRPYWIEEFYNLLCGKGSGFQSEALTVLRK